MSDLETSDTTGAGAPVATDQTASLAVADEGSASPADTVETSVAEQVTAEFLKEFGDEKVEGQEPETKIEPNPDGTVETERQDDDDDDKEKASRLSDEEFAGLPPKARSRMGMLSEQRRELRAEVKTLNSQVEDLQPRADALVKLQTFAAENNLRGEDVTNGLAIMAKLQNGNFEGFLAAIMPFVEQAQRATGKAISPEIQALVDSGDMTEDAGRRMTKAEADAELARVTAARATEAQQATTATAANRDLITQMQGAVQSTEAALKLSDPSYALKEPAIREQFGLLLRRGAIPKSAEDAAATIREIHASVTKAMALAPKPPLQPTAPVPGASDATRRAPAPSNFRDAAFAAWETAPPS